MTDSVQIRLLIGLFT